MVSQLLLFSLLSIKNLGRIRSKEIGGGDSIGKDQDVGRAHDP